MYHDPQPNLSKFLQIVLKADIPGPRYKYRQHGSRPAELAIWNEASNLTHKHETSIAIECRAIAGMPHVSPQLRRSHSGRSS